MKESPMYEQKVKQFVLTTVFAALGAVAVGFLFLRQNIFEVRLPAFVFLSGGLTDGIIFSTLRVASIRNSLAIVFLIVLAHVVLNRPIFWVYALRDALFVLGLSAALFVFLRYFFEHYRGQRVGRPLILSSLVAIAYTFVTVILDLAFLFSGGAPTLNLAQAVYFNLAQGFLLGIGLGAGIELSEVLKPRSPAGSEVS